MQSNDRRGQLEPGTVTTLASAAFNSLLHFLLPKVTARAAELNAGG